MKKFFNCTSETIVSGITFLAKVTLKEMVIYCVIVKSFGNMIRRKVRLMKIKRYTLPGRSELGKFFIC